MTYISSTLPVPVKGPKTSVFYGQSYGGRNEAPVYTIGMLAPLFVEWTRLELRRSALTVERYAEGLNWVIRLIGDLPVSSLHMGHVLDLRRKIEDRGCGPARTAAILNAFRSFLKFCERVPRLETLPPGAIRLPRIPNRDVVFLTKEEVAKFLETILPPGESPDTAALSRLCFRALVEVLLGTGARISEILRLRRFDVNFERREARTIGKGNKERVLFFTERSLEWLSRYLARRTDDAEALFITGKKYPPRPLSYALVTKAFVRARRKAGIKKDISAHMLRHTMATTLLFNGCPIGHIKELLGHERLDTTCRYYLGLDIRAAKEAHEKFLSYD